MSVKLRKKQIIHLGENDALSLTILGNVSLITIQKEEYRKLLFQLLISRIKSLTQSKDFLQHFFRNFKLSKILCLHAGSNLPILTEAE